MKILAVVIVLAIIFLYVMREGFETYEYEGIIVADITGSPQKQIDYIWARAAGADVIIDSPPLLPVEAGQTLAERGWIYASRDFSAREIYNIERLLFKPPCIEPEECILPRSLLSGNVSYDGTTPCPANCIDDVIYVNNRPDIVGEDQIICPRIWN